MWSSECRVKGDNHFPCCACSSSVHRARDVVAALCWLHTQLTANQTPKALSHELSPELGSHLSLSAKGSPHQGVGISSSLMNITRLLLAHPSSQPRSLQMVALLSAALAGPPGLVSPADLTSTLHHLLQVTAKDAQQVQAPIVHYLLPSYNCPLTTILSNLIKFVLP